MAADSLAVKVNLPDFSRQLREVSARVERLGVAAGLRAAGRVFRDEARSLAPVLREPDRRRIAGALRRSIVLWKTRSPRGIVSYRVGVAAKRVVRGRTIDPFYWRFLEDGWIPRGPGRKLRGGKRSTRLQRERLIAGGAQRSQYPFLAPAFARKGTAALAAFNERLTVALAEAQAVK